MEGVLFGEKHSIRDWGLVTRARPVISPPMVKKILIDIPGGDGSIDLTESLTGEPQYADRQAEFVFVIQERKRWDVMYSEIMNYLHGRQLQIVLDSDPGYYYEGRFEVNSWRSDNVEGEITISGTVKPYKMERYSSTEDWLWDDFSFVDGIIRDYREIDVNGEYELNIIGRRKRVVPIFICSNPMKVRYMGYEYDIPAGVSQVPGIRTREGDNRIILIGTGKVTIDYRGGSF